MLTAYLSLSLFNAVGTNPVTASYNKALNYMVAFNTTFNDKYDDAKVLITTGLGGDAACLDSIRGVVS